MPHVSVIIPTYNRKDYVQETIDSVLAQTYTDYEIIVVDDGSTDGTGEALAAGYGERIRYVWQENQGESVARNKGIALASGKYIAFLDSDDLWLSEKLDKQIAFLQANPDIAMVSSQAWLIDAEGNRISERRIGKAVSAEALALERLCIENSVPSPSTVVVDRQTLITSGGFDRLIRYGEDWDLWLRLRLLTDIHVLPVPLVSIRRHRATQCYYPSAVQNSQRREAHLSSLRKLFAVWREAPEGLQRQAVAWQYVRSSLLEAAVGNEQALIACLEQAAKYQPSLLESFERFGAAIAAQAALLYDLDEDENLSPSLCFVRAALDAVAQLGYDNRGFRRLTFAKSYESLGFTAYQKKQMNTAKYCLTRAVILDASLVKNAGICSILFEAVFGQRISSLRRELWSHLRRCQSGFKLRK